MENNENIHPFNPRKFFFMELIVVFAWFVSFCSCSFIIGDSEGHFLMVIQGWGSSYPIEIEV